jgi:hypothetical protein
VSETKKDPFFARRSDFLQAEAALRSKKIAKHGGKWDFLGQTASRLSSYKNLYHYFSKRINMAIIRKKFTKEQQL